MPFVRTPWSNPESDLEADDFCSCCLVDTNEAGTEKVKANCKLPVRSTPGGAYNINGMQAAYGALRGARGGVSNLSPENRRKAARKLLRLYTEAGLAVPDPLRQMAGG